MERQQCRNSVFCVIFCFWFFLGTICGILLFRILTSDRGNWIEAYCSALYDEQTVGLWSLILCWFRPLVLVGLLGLVPWGFRVLPVLIFLRGALIAYASAAWYFSGLDPVWIVVRGLTLLPLYVGLCRWTYFSFCLRRNYRGRTVFCEDGL